MIESVREQARQQVSVRSLRRLAVGSRYALIDLDATKAAAEHAVRAEPRQMLGDGRLSEQSFAACRPQQGNRIRVARPHAGLRVLSAKAEIEQQRRAVLRPDGARVRAQVGDNRPPAHARTLSRQAEGDALPPAVAPLADGLVGHRAKLGLLLDPDRAAIGHGHQIRVGADLHRFIDLAMELGNDAEAAAAPGGVRIGDVIDEQSVRHENPNGQGCQPANRNGRRQLDAARKDAITDCMRGTLVTVRNNVRKLLLCS